MSTETASGHLSSKVKVRKADGTTIDPATEQKQDDIVAAIEAIPATSFPANLRKEDGHGSAEGDRSWGYVTEVDDDGNVLVGRKTAAQSRSAVLATEDKAVLDSIDSKTPPLQAGRVPVDIGGASVTISGDVVVSFESLDLAPPEFDTPFGANEMRSTSYYSVKDYASIGISIKTDAASALNGAQVVFSNDGTDAGITRIATATIPATTTGVFFAVAREATYVKFVYTNGAVAQTTLQADAIASFNPLHASQVPAGTTLTDLNTGVVSNALSRGRQVTGVWTPILVDSSGIPSANLAKVGGATFVLGRAAAAASLPVALSTEDKASLDAITPAIQAIPPPQTNALTDAQLRASPVPVSADTELPAAAALGDTDANPTTPTVGAGAKVFNGTTWARARSTSPSADPGNVGIPAVGIHAIDGANVRRLAVASALPDGNSGGSALGQAGFVFNGSTFDRMRGDAAFGADVDVTRSALPTGAATSAKQDSQIAQETASATSLGVMDDWDENDRAKVNPVAGQVGVQGGAGASTANTQRVAIASDANAVNTGLAQPLTDAQLRNSPVPVSAPSIDNRNNDFATLLNAQPRSTSEFIRMEDNSGGHLYIGRAPSSTGGTTSTNVWEVVRFKRTATGLITAIEYQSGVSWDNRGVGWVL